MDGRGAEVHDLCVDHRRRHVLVAEKLLDRANVVAGREEAGREEMMQSVASCGFVEPGQEA